MSAQWSPSPCGREQPCGRFGVRKISGPLCIAPSHASSSFQLFAQEYGHLPPLNLYISETASSPVCTGDTQPQHPAGMQWQELASSRPRSMLFKMLSGLRGQSNHKVSKSPGPHHTAPHRTAPHQTTPHHTTAARQLRGGGACPQAESSGAWGGSTPTKPPGNQTPVLVPRDPEPPAHPGTMEGSPMAKPGTSA